MFGSIFLLNVENTISSWNLILNLDKSVAILRCSSEILFVWLFWIKILSLHLFQWLRCMSKYGSNIVSPPSSNNHHTSTNPLWYFLWNKFNPCKMPLFILVFFNLITWFFLFDEFKLFPNELLFSSIRTFLFTNSSILGKLSAPLLLKLPRFYYYCYWIIFFLFNLYARFLLNFLFAYS